MAFRSTLDTSYYLPGVHVGGQDEHTAIFAVHVPIVYPTPMVCGQDESAPLLCQDAYSVDT